MVELLGWPAGEYEEGEGEGGGGGGGERAGDCFVDGVGRLTTAASDREAISIHPSTHPVHPHPPIHPTPRPTRPQTPGNRKHSMSP